MSIAGLNPFLTAKAPTAAKAGREGAVTRSRAEDSGEEFSDTFAKVSSEQGKAEQSKAEQTPNKKTEVAPDANTRQARLGTAANTVKSVSGKSTEDRGEVEERMLPGNPVAGPSTPNLNGPITDRALPEPVNNNFFVRANSNAKAALAVDGEGEDSVDGLSRRVVWHEFLRKMKDDLGISAEDVLQAFSSLSEEDLAKPPVESLDKIVVALGLNDQQAAIAKQYFQELIAKTQSSSLRDELSRSSQQIDLSLMSQREVQRRSQQKALDQITNNFFVKPQAQMQQPAPVERPDLAQLSSAEGTSEKEQPLTPAEAALPPELRQSLTRMGQSASAATPKAINAEWAAPEATAPKATAPKATAAKLEVPDEMEEVSEPDAKVDQLVRKFMSAQAPAPQAQMSVAPEIAAPAKSAAPTRTMTSAAGPSAASLNGLLAKLNEAMTDGDEESSDTTSDASYLNSALLADAKLNSPVNSAADFKSQLAEVNPNQPKAVQDVVQQAQVMVRDGGGEMKVTLTPEGLGEVAMKVSVEKGKVNVQMVTESDEAKRLIERQLGELKSSLSQNNLQVDSIKIDTATNLGKQMEQQYQDAQRQATQSYWEQFRQDNQGWRRSFYEVASARPYSSQGEAQRDVRAPASVSEKRAGSRRLDLVA